MVQQIESTVKRSFFLQRLVWLIVCLLAYLSLYIILLNSPNTYPDDWYASIKALTILSFLINCFMVFYKNEKIGRISYIISLVLIMIVLTPERQNYYLVSFILDFIIVEGAFLFAPWISWTVTCTVSAYLFYISRARLLLWGVAAPDANYKALIITILTFFLCNAIGSLIYRMKKQWISFGDQVIQLSASNELLASTNVNLQGQVIEEVKGAVNNERKRIAREMHDTAASSLINSLSMLDACRLAARNEKPNTEILDVINDSCVLLRNCFVEIRSIISEVRQPYAEPIGLEAIKKLVELYRRSAQVNIYLNFGDIPSRIEPKQNELFFRTIQEGLTNAIRHGCAKDILVSFRSINNGIELTIKDNGIGVGTSYHEGYGLQGMQERVNALNGTLSISSSPGNGFCIRMWVPNQKDD